MAIRFIDTGYFKSPYVRALKGPMKTLYTFIICECSGAGIWAADFEVASLYIGFDVKKSDFETCFIKTGKAVDLKNGKYFFPDFIEHQYPKGLQEKNPAHINIIKELSKYQLLDENNKGALKPLERPSKGSKVIVIDTVKETVKETDTEKVKEKSPFQIFMQAFSDWTKEHTGLPPKINGADGKALSEIIKYLEGLEQVKTGQRTAPEVWQFILDNHSKWDPFNQKQIKLTQINSNLPNIIYSIKNGKPDRNTEQRKIDKVAELIRQGVYVDFSPKDKP